MFSVVMVALSLVAGFENPPAEARPQTWWHWMNGNVTKEGVTADLEAMAKLGLGGATIFDAGCDVPPGPVAFGTESWYDMVRHAANEARRLGLGITLSNCSGWSSSGGPWVKPEDGMKVLVTRERIVKGPLKFHEKLDRIPGCVWDIAVVAFPRPPAEVRNQPVSGFTCRIFAGRVMDADALARVSVSDDGVNFRPHCAVKVPVATSGFVDRSTRFVPFPKPVRAKDFRVDFDFPPEIPNPSVSNLTFVSKAGISCLAGKTFATRINHLPYDDYETTPDQVVRPEDVRDVSADLAADGTLTWDVPVGEWVIVRVACRANGRKNHPASRLGEGLEVDKLDAAAVGRHFDAYVGKCCDMGIPLAGALVDSYEVGSQNWTLGLEKTFAARRGYSLVPYLPAFTGRVMTSPRETERVLADFRRTVGELFAENYAGVLAKKCREKGIALSLEPYGSCPANNLTYGAQADIPQGEFWSFAADPNRRVETGNACLPGYIAHVWGKRYAAAESFTASPSSVCGGRWKTTPELIKSQADAVFAAGVNRLVFHRFAHQPWTKPWLRPGMTMGLWGMHLDRTQTWWDFVSGWMTYMSRCQWMLQEGTFVADILFFCGEECPNSGGDVDSDPEGVRERPTPFGYRHDLCALDALKVLKVENGEIVVPGGVRYRVLSLPHRPVESDELRGVVRALERAGATVVRGDPAAALAKLGVKPDFICRDEGVRPFWMHRRYADGDEAYFVACTNEAPVALSCSFRVTGKVPEVWDAETGLRERAREWREADGRTEVTVRLTAHGSKFVVFRPSSDLPVEKVRRLVSVTPVAGPWKLTFPIGHYFGTDEKKCVGETGLVDWTSFEDPDLKYFSGTAEYEVGIRDLGKGRGEGTRFVLDLGEVKNLAEVTVDGKTFPALWKPPFEVDITEALGNSPTSRVHSLRVRVTNLWINRLIGDEFLPDDAEWSPGRQNRWYHNIPIKGIPEWVAEGRRSPTGRHTFTTWKHYTKDDALFASGLLGPVRILTYDFGQTAVTRDIVLKDWSFSHDRRTWRDVSVPHDWAIGEAFDERIDAQSVTVREDGEKTSRRRVGRTGSLPWIGKGFYRRTVEIPPGVRAAELWFDGAMANAEVFADGRRVGGRKCGYAPFVVPLPVGKTAVAVEVALTTLPRSSRWYPGAGLIRPVVLRLDPTNRVEDVFVHTDRLGDGKAHLRVTSPAGERTFVVENPRLWTPETPNLYTLEPEGIRYGIRTVEWTNGVFRLNGVARKFKGVCLHHDLGPLGAAFDKAAFRRQVRLLKEIGCDSIRTSHNIPSSEQMDICDEMGLMVMAESFDEWHEAKCENGYHVHFDDWWRKDLEALARFHRNHPSVVMWSIGNEVSDQRTQDGTRLSREMVAFLHRLDPTRPVTQGHSWMPDALRAGGLQVMDIPGLTYRLPFYPDVHRVSKCGGVLGVETASTVSSRGFYAFPDEPGAKVLHTPNHSSSYDVECCPWSNLPDDDWAMQDDNSWTLGEFVWTGFDYLGEPAPYDAHRSRSSYFGLYDLAGLPKDRAFLYRARWRTDAQTLHVLPHWTWPERLGKVTPVYVYTSCPEAELFVNGKSQGRRRFDRASRLDRYRLRWRDVIYEPGELKVVAYDGRGVAVAEKSVWTAGEPHRLVVTAEPTVSSDDSVRFFTVDVVDARGRLCPRAAVKVDFTVSGEGAAFVAAENGDPTDFDTLSAPSRKTFNGRLTAVVRVASGKMCSLTASSPGLQDGGVVLEGRRR